MSGERVDLRPRGVEFVKASEATRGLILFGALRSLLAQATALQIRMLRSACARRYGPGVHTVMRATRAFICQARSMGELIIECPRCGDPATEAYYGPCTSCRTELRATLGGDATDIAAVEYEPKMNVTPNAVALKDD